MTPKQKKFLEYIREFKKLHGYAPSQREIAEGLKLKSVGSIQRYKEPLIKAGLLKNAGLGRGLELADFQENAPSVVLPLMGKVAAGLPIEAISTNDSVEVPASMLRNYGHHFALKVKGQSMIEDAILDGDLVVVRQQNNAENGQIIVAIVDNDATIKRYYKTRKGIELHPANPEYDVIHVPPNAEFRILGVLAGVIRTT